MSNSLGGPGGGASSAARRSCSAICRCFLLRISVTINFRMAYGSSAQKVSAENPPVAPLQQRDRRDGQISLTLARADHQGLNHATVSPQVIDHKTIGVRARVHPPDLADLRLPVQQTDVLQLK